MKIKRGSTRLVFIFRHFVIKLAVPRLPDKAQFIFLSKMFVKKHLRGEINFVDSSGKPMNFPLAFRCILSPIWAGFSANWREFIFYSRKKNSFLAKTSFSLFGLINFQTKIEMIVWGKEDGAGYQFSDLFDFIMYYQKDVPESAVALFMHHMYERSNYGLDKDGRLAMCDYGEKAVSQFITEHGEELHRQYPKPPGI